MPNITRKEASRLDVCERKIERAIKNFTEAGEALSIIRVDKLYRSEYPSFDAYCKERWGFTRQRANQLIGAVGQTKELPNLSNESAAREFSKYDDDTRKVIKTTLLDKETVSAGDIKKVVKERTEFYNVVTDGTGDPVTEAWFMDVLATAISLSEITKFIKQALTRFDDDGEWNHYFQGSRKQEFRTLANNMVNVIKWAMPHKVCPYCSGKGCDNCQQSGWVNKDTYDATARELQ
jgi:hypothetical protein